MVSLQGAFLGGRGKDRSWQATTKASGKGGESPGLVGFRMSSLRALPRERPREAVSWGLGGISNHLGIFIFRAGGRRLISR